MHTDETQRAYWDGYYRELGERDADLDWGGRWTEPFLPLLRGSGATDVFHVNADDDRPLRERVRPVARELEPGYVLEEAGQTIRYCSREYLTGLLAGWEVVALEHVEVHNGRSSVPLKRVWRAAARATAPAPPREGR